MRMRQASGQQALDDGHFPSAPRMAAQQLAHDEQLGKIFHNMRLSTKASREAIARRLATSTAVVDTFEAGAIAALPHWKETERIVRAYCELLRLDPEPILWRIRTHLQELAASAQPVHPRPPPEPAPPAWVGPAAARTETARPGVRRRRRRGRALFALSLPIALSAIVVYVAQVAPRQTYRAMTLLPDAVEGPLRAGLEYLLVLTAPQRDGLKWVDVGDPRVRKADKLQPGKP